MIYILCFAPIVTHAQTTVPDLVVRQIKISGEEQVVLQVTTDGVELGDYWLGYVSQEADARSLVPTLRLPTFRLDAGQAVVLLSEPAETCDAVLMMKLPFDFAVTRGTLVLKQLLPADAAGNLTFVTRDAVDWAKPSSSAATATAAIDLRKESSTNTTWYRDPATRTPWRVGALESCTLTLVRTTSEAEPQVITWALEATEPTAIIENVNEVEPTSVDIGIPSENVGLAPPLITELLPNPQGTGTDSVDEYIELYNSNEVAFDLTGFTLQTGLVTKHSYVFPAGSFIAAHGFRALYAHETGLSMSNTSGQVTLLDRSKQSIAQSDPYDSAPDGQPWALANGTWYWTTKMTPATTNVIAQPILKPATGAKRLTVKTAASKGTATKKVKSASTKAKTTKAKSKNSDAATAPVKQTASIPGPVPVHPGVLAAVLACALGYGAYVYRKDLANAFYKLRRH